jgi:hypothetical protein
MAQLRDSGARTAGVTDYEAQWRALRWQALQVTDDGQTAVSRALLAEHGRLARTGEPANIRVAAMLAAFDDAGQGDTARAALGGYL